MCLIIKKDQNLSIANIDIIVYKVTVRLDGVLKTFYRDAVVEIGKTYRSDIDIQICKPLRFEIERGLHSFRYKYSTVEYKHPAKVVIKCVIPKGRIYYYGWCQGEESYASDTLTYLEIVE